MLENRRSWLYVLRGYTLSISAPKHGLDLPYSEKLSRKKTAMNFVVLWLFASFLHEIWGCDVLWCGESEQSVKVFSAKSVLFTNSRSFLP